MIDKQRRRWYWECMKNSVCLFYAAIVVFLSLLFSGCSVTNDQHATISGPVENGAHASPNAWDRFVDSWGTRPGEFFVIACNFNTGVYTLARTPGGAVDCQRLVSELEYPDGKQSSRYYPCDLVRVRL